MSGKISEYTPASVLQNTDLLDISVDAGGEVYNESNSLQGSVLKKFTYDIIVDAAGTGHYTDLSTALSTEANNTTFFVKQGSYTLTADALVKEGQHIHFDSVS